MHHRGLSTARSALDVTWLLARSPDGVRAETAWSCMQCNACVEICPVGIEQAPIINQLRRRLEMRGHRFSTQNDSEVIAVYIADRLQTGEPLEEALRASVSDLDGTFAYLISTDRGVGLARDQFATKPLLYAENDDMVVLSSEEIALRRVFPDPALVPRELAAKEVRWWLN